MLFGGKQQPAQYTVTVVWYDTGTDTSLPFAHEDWVRRWVREEIAELLPVDVPDAPPEGLS